MKRKSIHSNIDEIEDYASMDFWDNRYKSGYRHAWYFDYATLKPIIDMYIMDVVMHQ